MMNPKYFRTFVLNTETTNVRQTKSRRRSTNWQLIINTWQSMISIVRISHKKKHRNINNNQNCVTTPIFYFSYVFFCVRCSQQNEDRGWSTRRRLRRNIHTTITNYEEPFRYLQNPKQNCCRTIRIATRETAVRDTQ